MEGPASLRVARVAIAAEAVVAAVIVLAAEVAAEVAIEVGRVVLTAAVVVVLVLVFELELELGLELGSGLGVAAVSQQSHAVVKRVLCEACFLRLLGAANILSGVLALAEHWPQCWVQVVVELQQMG